MNFSILLSLLVSVCSLVQAEVGSVFSTDFEGYWSSVLESSIDNHLNELVKYATQDEPMIIFQFDNYKLNSLLWKGSSGKYRFLEDKFYFPRHSVVFNKDYILEENSDYSIVDLHGKLNDEYLESLNSVQPGSKVVLIRFNDNQYDLAQLDQFLSKSQEQLAKILPNTRNIALQFFDRSTGSSKGKNRQARDEPDQRVGSTPESIDKKPDSDDENASKLFTEGLLSCLLISGILLWILVIAIYWLVSLDISYGALQKSTNPLKKTN
ncbi:HDL045Cp [Eremothecium sinecaudum]|uniref:HDL045Cp n=1 Tax=Eremothecium sinecaudum TaxID=45286 RepID=A0A0X8HSJ9_9SACH|nr:HDL045Cp [Eremothecium sinecaudum]AMD20699.1 HDL045Cp [Eremothecium sinecaudum]